MSRRGYEFSSETREAARKREKYSCKLCGEPGHTEVHHLIPIFFAKEANIPPSLITSLMNAIAVCPSCHEMLDEETQNMSYKELMGLAQSVLGLARAG